MQLILGGGGYAHESAPVDAAFVNTLADRRVLYVPHAIAPHTWSFERAREWMSAPASFADLDVTMWTELAGRTIDELRQFDAIYLMGGNTYTLLAQLRNTGFLELVRQFAEERVIYGVSAGAIVLGHSIGTAATGPAADRNDVGLTDLQALDLIGARLIAAHYEVAYDHQLADLSTKTRRPIVAIPSTSGVLATECGLRAIGTAPVAVFSGSRKTIWSPGSDIATCEPVEEQK